MMSLKTGEKEFILDTLADSIYPGLRDKIEFSSISTPRSLQQRNGSTDGAISGWAFTNREIPVLNRLPKIYQAGQWFFSPSGLRTAIITGNEVFKLVGPNGSGKTTIVEILEGLRSYDSGSFSVLGRSPSHPLVKQSVGVFLQESRPMDNLTPREILRLYRTFYDRGLEPDEALASVALEPQSRKLIRKLSTGQKRRVDIAIAIINDPLLVFLDEPTLGLDPVARRNFWDIIRNLRARDRSVVLTTHYMDEAEALSDRIAILSYGRILAIDPPDRLIESSGLKQSIRIRFVPPVSKKIRAFFSGIPDAHWHDTALSFTAVDIERVLPRLFKEIHDYGIEIAELGVHRPTIEEVFHLLTSRSNSDA